MLKKMHLQNAKWNYVKTILVWNNLCDWGKLKGHGDGNNLIVDQT